MCASEFEKPRLIPVPEREQIDALTRYIYSHYPRLLSERESMAHRVHTGLMKRLGQATRTGSNADARMDDFWFGPVRLACPDLLDEISRRGSAAVMREAADRVLREHAGEVVLNNCPKCGNLLLTPRAKQCFSCGFDGRAQNP